MHNQTREMPVNNERRGGVSIVDVDKGYEGKLALQGVSLDIKPGEFVSIVGPSGSGKSTILRIVAGLEEHDAGTVHINGTPTDHVSPKDRDVAMVFQTYALYPHLTAERNIAVPLLMRRSTQIERLPLLGRLSARYGRVKAEIEAEVRKTAGLLGIEDLLRRKPAKMSGGQRQRVALGRAIIRNPSVFLMDEPLSNLDAALRVTMCAEIKELQQRLGVTCLYVTHDQVEAMKLSDRMAVIFDGQVRQFDRPETVYHQPSHRTVAEFVGVPRMNLLNAAVAVDGRLIIEGVATELRTTLAPQSGLTVGIRPEAVALSDGPTALRGRTKVVEKLGSETIVWVNLPEPNRPVIAVRLNAFDQAVPRAGDTVGLRLAIEHAVLFDASGSRIDLDRQQQPAPVAAHG